MLQAEAQNVERNTVKDRFQVRSLSQVVPLDQGERNRRDTEDTCHDSTAFRVGLNAGLRHDTTSQLRSVQEICE